MSKTRELIISPKVNQAQLTKFLPQLEEEGIKTVYLDPKKLGKKKTKLKTISTSNSMITKSKPFFEIDNTFSMSEFDNTSNLIPQTT